METIGFAVYEVSHSGKFLFFTAEIQTCCVEALLLTHPALVFAWDVTQHVFCTVL